MIPPATPCRSTASTLEEALLQILSANQLFYKVLNERTILIIPDNAQNRAKYEEQVVRIFYLSHADATEVAQLLNTVLRVPGVAVIPTIAPNKTSNTITIRATAAMAAIMERVIDANDRPRAEVVLDVSIMEVNRARAKQFGIDLSAYNIGGIFSPEVSPTGGTTTGGGTGTGGNTGGTSGSGTGTAINVPPFNANTISNGISAADFYLIVPQAIARFLESDTRTKLVAKPQLRGQEGQKITLNLGDDIPVPQTTFGSLGRARQHRDPADLVVQLPAGGRERDHDPARHVRQRHRPRVDRREQHARRGHQHRGAEPAVVRHAQGRNEDPAARRRVHAAGRPAARGRTPGNQGRHRPDPRARSPQPVRQQRQFHRANRHRHAADAAHRADP